jgi:hypothetical protein
MSRQASPRRKVLTVDRWATLASAAERVARWREQGAPVVVRGRGARALRIIRELGKVHDVRYFRHGEGEWTALIGFEPTESVSLYAPG